MLRLSIVAATCALRIRRIVLSRCARCEAREFRLLRSRTRSRG